MLSARKTTKDCLETAFYARLGQRFSTASGSQHNNQNQEENEDNHSTCYIQEYHMKFAGGEGEADEWCGKQGQNKEEEKEAATPADP